MKKLIIDCKKNTKKYIDLSSREIEDTQNRVAAAKEKAEQEAKADKARQLRKQAYLDALGTKMEWTKQEVAEFVDLLLRR